MALQTSLRSVARDRTCVGFFVQCLGSCTRGFPYRAESPQRATLHSNGLCKSDPRISRKFDMPSQKPALGVVVAPNLGASSQDRRAREPRLGWFSLKMASLIKVFKL